MPAAEGGGRWPGPIIERDGERCYCGSPWYPLFDRGVVDAGGEPGFPAPGINSGSGSEIASLHVYYGMGRGPVRILTEFLYSGRQPVFRLGLDPG
jgi:hypothetical protein